MNKRIIITTGLALFAMFFGAGNIIFPLALGTEASSHYIYAGLAFLVAGVGLPFLGLFATSLYQGDYWTFFGRIGQKPALVLIAFLILIIGPLVAIPRTEAVTYHSLAPVLFSGEGHPYIFSLSYCILLFFLTYRGNKIIDIIGYYLSPIKLITFLILIAAGLIHTGTITTYPQSISTSVQNGLLNGYSTMDLIGAFFFCTVTYRAIVLKANQSGITNPTHIIKLFMQSCVLGGALLGLVYVGFMFVALTHATSLQGVETAQMIEVLATLSLGKFGSVFVGVCVLFACIATATALTEVATAFFYEHVLKGRIPRTACLIAILIVTFAMSITGFSGIMRLAVPILEVVYPILIIYCIINIYLSLRQAQTSPHFMEKEAIS